MGIEKSNELTNMQLTRDVENATMVIIRVISTVSSAVKNLFILSPHFFPWRSPRKCPEGISISTLSTP